MTWNTESLKWSNSDYNYVLLPINDFSIAQLFIADLVNYLNIVDINDIINTVTTYPYVSFWHSGGTFF